MFAMLEVYYNSVIPWSSSCGGKGVSMYFLYEVADLLVSRPYSLDLCDKLPYLSVNSFLLIIC